MKIVTDNSVYVQKNDIAYLNHSDLPIPASIYLKVFGNGNGVIIDDSNRYEFVEFHEPEEIEFFKGIDWMVDYHEVKDLTKEELIALGESIAEEKNSIADRFNAMSLKEQKRNKNLVSQYDFLEFKIYSVRDVIWFKKGQLEIEFPKGVEAPVKFEQPKETKKLMKMMNKIKKN